MTKEITKQPYTQAQIALITRTVAKGATKDELGLFLNVSKRCGLDPFSKQIYFIKRNVWNSSLKKSESVGTIQTGIDGYRAIAEKSGNYAGSDDAVYDTEQEDHPNKATITVWKIVNGEKCGFTASARWKEYAAVHPKKGTIMGQWKTMPYLMLAKCAESLALRKAFPNDLSGLYTEDEMSQVDATVVDVKDVKAEETKKDKEMKDLMSKAAPEKKDEPEINEKTVCAGCTNKIADCKCFPPLKDPGEGLTPDEIEAEFKKPETSKEDK